MEIQVRVTMNNTKQCEHCDEKPATKLNDSGQGLCKSCYKEDLEWAEEIKADKKRFS